VQPLGCAFPNREEIPDEEAVMVDRIERELVLPAAPAEVWEVITGPGWLADEVELDLVPGGEARFATEADTRTGWVEEARAPGEAEDGGCLVFWWTSGQEPATRVEVRLEPEAPATTRLYLLEERPLEVLDLIGVPLPGTGDASRGPAMLLAA
jgi:uncharacterized protein YndB with AHSA1/START domain